MEKKLQKKDKYKLLEPVLCPELRKNIKPLDVDQEKYEEIGAITLNLFYKNELSIYKLLYSRESNSEFGSSNSKTIRSEYLKKLVATNEYFPSELMLDKFRRRADVSYEEKLKSKILSMKDKAKSERKNTNLDMSRKTSNVDMDNKISTKDGKESKEKEKKSKFITNEENQIIEENQSDAAEENEEQSFYEDEDDYLMQSEDADLSDSAEGEYDDRGD
jgi:uncharacterized protein YbaR (Trm112 family)